MSSLFIIGWRKSTAQRILRSRAPARRVSPSSRPSRLPALLVPYPYAADDHQTRNAEIFVRANAAVLVKESRIIRRSSRAQRFAILLSNPRHASSHVEPALRRSRQKTRPLWSSKRWRDTVSQMTPSPPELDLQKFLTAERHAIHLIGVAGSGMSGIAALLLELGHDVRGSDKVRTLETERLQQLGLRFFFARTRRTTCRRGAGSFLVGDQAGQSRS